MKIKKESIERTVKNIGRFLKTPVGADFVCAKIYSKDGIGKLEANNVIADFEYEGEDLNVAIPIRNLEAVLARCGENITLTKKDNLVEIKDAANKWALITVEDTVDNTIRRKNISTEIHFSLQEWNSLKNVLFANAKTSNDRYQTLFVNPTNNGTEYGATDGFTAAIYKKDSSVCNKFNIPNDIFKVEFKDDVLIKYGEGIISLHSGNETYIIQEIQTNAPDFKALLDKANSDKKLQINTLQLADAINKVCIKGGESTDKILLSFVSDGILMEMNDAMFGYAETKIPLLFNPLEGIRIAIDASRLLSICKHAPVEVILHVTDNKTPILFSSTDGTWKAIVSLLLVG